MERKKKHRKLKLAPGQLNLIGDIFQNKIKYPPKISTDHNTGLSIVVWTLPKGCKMTNTERRETESEVERLQQEIKNNPKRNYYFKKHRDEETKRMLRDLVE